MGAGVGWCYSSTYSTYHKLDCKEVQCLLNVSLFTHYIYQQIGHTALDKARDNNNRDLAILLAKSNQVSNVLTFKVFHLEEVHCPALSSTALYDYLIHFWLNKLYWTNRFDEWLYDSMTHS